MSAKQRIFISSVQKELALERRVDNLRRPRIAEPLFLARHIEKSGTKSGAKLGSKSAPSRHQVKILAKASTGAALTDLMAVARRTNRTKFRDQVIQPLMDQGLLEMTHPDSPRSPQQKYRLTAQGAAWLANQTGKKK